MKIDEEKGPLIPKVLPFERDFELLQAVKQYLPADGNLLVWGLSMEESPSLYLSTSGRVQFLGDDDPSRYFTMQVATGRHRAPANQYVHGNYPFLAVSGSILKTRGEWNNTFDKYFEGQTFENNTNWCDLQIPLFQRHLFASNWDVILVRDQGGVGGSASQRGAGIFQSLFNSMILTGNQTASKGSRAPHILVDNFDRDFERNVADKLLGRDPDAIILNNRVGVYTIRESDQTFGWIPDCPRPLLRLSRVYNGPWSKVQLQKGMEVVQTKDNILFFGIKNMPHYWHFATEGEVLFLENILNSTQIHLALNNNPEITILPVNYTSHDVQEDRIAKRDWDVLFLEPFQRDQMAVLHEIERLQDVILRPGLKVIVSDYQVQKFAEKCCSLFGGKPWATIKRGAKKKEVLVAFFTIN